MKLRLMLRSSVILGSLLLGLSALPASADPLPMPRPRPTKKKDKPKDGDKKPDADKTDSGKPKS